MYKVIIVDDEEIIRYGLKSFIPWEDIGFEIVGEFEDGSFAIDFLEHNYVDLIVTDIKMAKVSGIDIAKYVYENNLSTRVCLISGYKDFEYARQAIQYNVEFYLTKPTVIDETINIIKDIKGKIDASIKAMKKTEEYDDLIDVAKQQFFSDIILGNFDNATNFINKASYMESEIDNSMFCSVWINIINLDDYVDLYWEYGKETFFTAIGNFLNDEFQNLKIYKVLVAENALLLIASSSNFDTTNSFTTGLDKKFSAVKKNIKTIMSLDIEYQIGKTFIDINEFIEYYSQPIWVKENNYSDEIHSLIDKKNYYLLLEKYKNIICCIINSRSDLKSNLSKIFTTICKLPIDNIKSIINDMLSIIFSKLKNICTKNFYSIFNYNINLINNATNLDDIEQYAMQILSELVSIVNSEDNNSSASIIQRAKEYIEENYASDISLEDVANYVFLNSVYFSRFFKAHTGENFSNFLINVRVQKAISLLSQDKYKVYEIGELVGYKNSKYFTRQFKQVIGYTPKEYTAKLKSGDNNYESI